LALADTQRRYHIPIGFARSVGVWHGGDVEQDPGAPERTGVLVPRYRTFDELRQYCYGVASVVGLVCIKIFGYRDPAAEPLAEHCGLAFQLTNIIRDVKEDVSMGRVYFPERIWSNSVFHPPTSPRPIRVVWLQCWRSRRTGRVRVPRRGRIDSIGQ